MRLRLPLLLLASLLTALSTPTQAATTTDGTGTLTIYILTGQSNAEGAVKGSPLSSDLLNIYQSSKTQLWYSNISQYSSSGTYASSTEWGIPTTQLPIWVGNPCMGPEYGFLYMMEKKGWLTSDSDNVAVVKLSTDGGANDLWLKGGWAYTELLSTVTSAISKLDKSQYATINIAGLLYLQGESDSETGSKVAGSRYADLLSNLQTDLAGMGYEGVTVTIDTSVLGQPSMNATSTEQLKNYAETHSNAAWVSTGDLKMYETEHLHYTGASQITIGARYAYQMALLNGIDVGTVRSQENVALDQASAWWGNSLSKLSTQVAEWDLSSSAWDSSATKAYSTSLSLNKISDTVGTTLNMYGISILDTYSEGATTVVLVGGSKSTDAPSTSDTTLALGAGGLSVGGLITSTGTKKTLQFDRDLQIGANLDLTANQTWRVGGGSSITVTGAGSVTGGTGATTNLITGSGNVTIEKITGTSGDAVVTLNQADTANSAHTWTLADGVTLNLSNSSAWNNDSVVIQDNATVTLGGYDTTALSISTLSVGSGATLDLGTSSSLSLTTSQLTLGSGSTLNFDLSSSGSDKLTITGSDLTSIDNLNIALSYGTGVSSSSSFTIMEGVSGDLSTITFNKDVTSVLESKLTLENNNLVVSFSILGLDAVVFPDCTEGYDSLTAESSEYDATSGLTGTASTKVTSGTCTHYNTTTGNVTSNAYSEVVCSAESGMIFTQWAAAVGVDGTQHTGDAALKISGDYSGSSATTIFGAVNATKGVTGDVYVEIDTADVTYSTFYTNDLFGSVCGVYNSTVDGTVEVVINSGTYNKIVNAGSANASGTVNDGTILLINGGTFTSTVAAGNNKGGTINGGTKLVITDGTFSSTVYGGNATGGTINGGITAVIDGGTFSENVFAAGNGGTVTGDVNMVIEGGTFKKYVMGDAGATVTGDINLTITGGDFSGCSGIYAGSGLSGNITGNTTITLQNIDNKNSFATYTGILSGGNGSSGANLTGTKTLVLDNYTADSFGANLSNVETIKAINGTSTATTWEKLTVATSVVLEENTEIDVSAATTLAKEKLFSGTGTVGLTASGNYIVTKQIMDTRDTSNMTGLSIGSSATLFVDEAFSGQDSALQVGDFSGSGTISGQNGNGSRRYIIANQTTDDVLEFSGTFNLSSSNRSVGLIKKGVGTLLLTGTNASDANLEVDSGAVQLGDSSTTGTWVGNIEVGTDGTLIYDHTDNVSRDGSLNVDGTLVQQGTGKLTLTNVTGSGILDAEASCSLTITDITSFTGSVQGNSQSELEIGGTWTMKDSTFAQDTKLTLLHEATAITTNTTYNTGVILAQDATMDVGDATGFMGGIQAENGTLTKTGAGQLTVYSNSNIQTLAMDAGEVNIIGDLTLASLTDSDAIVATKAANTQTTAVRTVALLADVDADSADTTLDATPTTATDTRMVNVVGSLTATDITGYTGGIKGGDNARVTVGGTWDMSKSTFADSAVVTLLKGSSAVADGFSEANLLVVEKESTVQVDTSAEFLGGISAQKSTLTKTGTGTLTVGADSTIDTLAIKGGTVDVQGNMTVAHLKASEAASKMDVTGVLNVALSKDSDLVSMTSAKGGTVNITGSGALNSLTAESGSTVSLTGEAGSTNPQVTLKDGLNLSGAKLGMTFNTNTEGFESAGSFIVEGGNVNLNGTTISLASLDEYSLPETLNDLHLTLVTVNPSSTTSALRAVEDADSATTITADGASVSDTSGYFNFYYDFAVQTSDNEVYLTGTLKLDSPFEQAASTANSGAGAELVWGARQASSASTLGKVREAIRQDIQSGDQARLARATQSLAAIAGSTINALGTAQRDALRSQLGWIRNRTTLMGVDPDYTHEDMPYYHMWIEGTGASTKLDSDGDEGGYKLNSWGGTIGVDADVSEHLTIGAAFTANYGDLKSSAAEYASGDLDSYYVSLFARYQNKAWAHTFIVTGGLNEGSLDRTINYGTGSYSTQGDTEGSGFGAMYELTYDIPLNEEKSSIFQPLFNASIVKTSLDSYSETGADNAGLEVGKQEWTTATLALGARWMGLVGTNVFGREALLELRANIAQDFGDDQGKTSVGFVGTPGFTQTVYGAKVGKTAGQFGVGLSLPVGQQGTVFVNGNADVRSGAHSFNASLGYRYSF